MSSLAGGVHAICDAYVDEYARLYPTAATEFGIQGHDATLPDLSPAGHEGRAELARRGLAAIGAARPGDDGERAARAVFAERMRLEVDLHAAGLPGSALNATWCPVQEVRQAFDLMPTASAEDWAVIAARLAAVPAALAGYQESLTAAVVGASGASGSGSVSGSSGAEAARRVPALRQVEQVIGQCRAWAGMDGGGSAFGELVAGAEQVPGVTAALRADLDAGARAAAAAYAELARYLREESAPGATDVDAVGEDVYRLWSRKYLGAEVDLREAYEWGWAEFRRIRDEQSAAAARVLPGGSVREAADALDADPRYRLTGVDAFRDWLQERADRALADLAGTYFDVPDALMRLECLIAPPGGGSGAYYTGPADDLSRPGRMWWNVPAGKEVFATWRDLSTVYHEGVPGHHLQIGTAVTAPGLNRFQRLLCFIDGHGEGWALYAERLMQDFGFLDDGELLGMLDKALFRAARVIVDIGLHLGLRIPGGTGFHEGEVWTPELAVEFLASRTLMDARRAAAEIDRCLGWPGQAPAYKLGERLWLQLREEARARDGAGFELRRFHMDALRAGPAGLDTLRDLVLGRHG